MYKTEWAKIEKEVSQYLIGDARVCYGGNITNELESRYTYDEQGTQYLAPNDIDYNVNQILSIHVGPFSCDEQKEMTESLLKIADTLEKLGYEVDKKPLKSISKDQPYRTIQFRRPLNCSIYVKEFEEGTT